MEARAVRRKRRLRHPHQDGFTLLQTVIVLAVAMIVSAATVISIRAGRPAIHLSNSAHQLAVHMERARADSVRRRASSGSESSVQILNATTYRVTMGWNGSGTLSSRDFNLEGDVVFDTNAATIAFDWRGRPVSGTEITLALRHPLVNNPIQVDVTGSGDVTVGSDIFQDQAIPAVNLNANVTGDVSPAPPPNPHSTPVATATPILEEDPTPIPTPGPVDPSPTPTPNSTPTPTATPTPTPHGNPHNNPTPTPTATPTPTPEIPQCAPVGSPNKISISKSGGSATLVVSIASGGGTVTATGPKNLTITPSSLELSSGGTGNITITSNDQTRGEFTVTLSTPCGSTSIIVTVTN